MDELAGSTLSLAVEIARRAKHLWPKRRIECGVVDADQFRSLFKLAHYAPLRAKLLQYCIASSERMTRQKKDVLYMLGYELVHIALQRDMRYERSVQDVLNERAPNDYQYRSVCTANHFEGNGSNWGGDARLKG